MKKTFPLTAPGKDDARVRDKIRHEVNKYVKREGRKALPEGYFRWDFACRVGGDETRADSLPLADVAAAIDRVAEEGSGKVFVEITARPVKRSGMP